MIGSRTRHSLAQYLDLQETALVIALLDKHRINHQIEHRNLLITLIQALEGSTDEGILSLIDEIARTTGDLRCRINPKFRHNQRFSDLHLCLQLDGYLIQDDALITMDPSINDAPPIEDDLTKALRESGLPQADEIVAKINDSSSSFRSSPPNFNACLNDVRVALETLARAIALSDQSSTTPTFDPMKWGSVISFLRQVNFITQEEEKGLAGVYGFVSPGSHRPVGISEEQTARLGRSFALGMCWFLLKTYQSLI